MLAKINASTFSPIRAAEFCNCWQNSSAIFFTADLIYAGVVLESLETSEVVEAFESAPPVKLLEIS